MMKFSWGDDTHFVILIASDHNLIARFFPFISSVQGIYIACLISFQVYGPSVINYCCFHICKYIHIYIKSVQAIYSFYICFHDWLLANDNQLIWFSLWRTISSLPSFTQLSHQHDHPHVNWTKMIPMSMTIGWGNVHVLWLEKLIMERWW